MKSQIEFQLRSLDYLTRNEYKLHLKKLIFESDNKEDIGRWKNVVNLIEQINQE